jgi:hypothetical protein
MAMVPGPRARTGLARDRGCSPTRSIRRARRFSAPMTRRYGPRCQSTHESWLPNSCLLTSCSLRQQVSPFNLWTVRAVRYVTIALAFISFVWWALLLVSAFATPPGLHTRGGGFYALANATVATCLLVFHLAFFSTPSKSTRVLCVSMAVCHLYHSESAP